MRTAAILLLSAHGASPLRPLPLLRRAISRARTPSLAEQPPEVGVDTDGDGVADSIALDTVGDGFADTLVPLAAEDTWRRRAQELRDVEAQDDPPARRRLVRQVHGGAA